MLRQTNLLEGYMPSLCNESPTHLAVIAAAISGTMYWRPPVSSNIITTSDTSSTCHRWNRQYQSRYKLTRQM